MAKHSPVAPEDTSARIYIGRLSKTANETDVDTLCSTFGRVRHVNIKTGFAFVDFESSQVAKDAAEHLNNTVFLNDKIVVEIAKGRPKFEPKPAAERSFHPFTRTNHRLIVENLHTSISWQTLKDHMRKVSQPIYCEVVNGNGIIEFATHNDMISAQRKLDQTELLGHRLHLREDLATRGRAGGDSRGNSPYQRDRYASPPPRRRRSYSRSPPPIRRYSRSPPPPLRRGYSRSRSPPPRRRYSPSPPPMRRYSRSPPPMRRCYSRSPPPIRRYSRSPPPMRRGYSRSPPPMRRYSRSPPPREARRYSRSPPPSSHHYRR